MTLVNAHVILFSGLYLIGWLLLALLTYRLPRSLRAAASIFVGLAVWLFCAMAVLASGVGYTIETMGVALSILGVVVLGFTWARQRDQLLSVATAVEWGVAFTLILIFSHYTFIVLSFDSHRMITFGHLLARYQNLTAETITGFGDWNIGTILWESIAPLVGYDFIFVIFPLCFLSLVFLLFTFALNLVREREVPRWKVNAISLLVSLFFVSAYFETPMAMYVSPNLIFGGYLLIAVGSACCFLQTRDRQWLTLAALCLPAVQLLRVESPLVVVLFLAMFLPSLELSRRETLRIILPTTSLGAAWYSWLCLSDSYLAADARLLYWGMVGATVLFAVLAIIPRPGFMAVLWRELDLIATAVLAGAVAVSVFLWPDHMAESFNQFVTNLIRLGSWAGTWWALLPVCVVLWSRPGSRIESLVSRFVLSFVMLTLFLGAFRKPFRHGWSDSANRLMNHVLPLICLVVIVSLIGLLQRRRRGAALGTGCESSESGRDNQPLAKVGSSSVAY